MAPSIEQFIEHLKDKFRPASLLITHVAIKEAMLWALSESTSFKSGHLLDTFDRVMKNVHSRLYRDNLKWQAEQFDINTLLVNGK
jgi:hypothetical protein